jgi:hypothetical protein
MMGEDRPLRLRRQTWPSRPDPVTLLEQSSEGRVPELIPIRYGRTGAVHGGRDPGVAIAIAPVSVPEQQGRVTIAAICALIVATIVSVPYLQWTRRHAFRAPILH